MNCLFLNLASRSEEPTEGACIACVDATNTLSIQFVDERISDSEIIPMVETMLKEAGWTFKDLTNIACITGPGGFTSLRVGITLANVLADQLNIPITGIPLWELYETRARIPAEARGPRPGARGPTWLHSTKRTHVFKKATSHAEPVLIEIDALPNQIDSDSVLIGELMPEHRKILEKFSTNVDLDSIEETLPALLASATWEHTPITPWYGRGL